MAVLLLNCCAGALAKKLGNSTMHCWSNSMKFLSVFVLSLVALTLNVAAVGEDKNSPAQNGSFITLRQGDGREFRAFVAVPSTFMEANQPMQAAIHFLSTMKEVKRPCEMFVYPGADHGYAQPLFNEGKNYNPEAVRTTWVLVEDFLGGHLRP